MMPVMIEGTGSAVVNSPLVDAVLRSSTLPIVVWDLDGAVVTSNDAFSELLGYGGKSLTALRRVTLFHPDDRGSVEARMQRRRDGDAAVETYEARIWTANKRVVRATCRSTPVVEDGRVVGDVVTCGVADPNLGDALERQTDQYLELFKRITDAVYMLDERGVPAWMNRSAERLFGRTVEVMRSTPRNEVLFPEAERGQDNLRQVFSSGGAVPDEIQFRIKRPDGEMRWVRGSLLMLRDTQGRHTRSIVIARDVTELRRREHELREAARRSEQEAKIDPLTGLGNRRAFEEAMEAVTRRETERGETADASLIVMDVDRLKLINDALGHLAGDEALRTVAQALTARTRSDDQVFRIGGDEFAVITTGGDAAILAERLRAPIRYREPEPWITVSVGLAPWNEGPNVFEVADTRMYAMKRSQRDAPDTPPSEATSPGPA